MKYLIASDLHGSAYYVGQLMEAFEREGADYMLLLGDLLYHGPRNDLPKDYETKQVMNMLNAVKDKLICVRGNCDAEVDQMVLDFPMMADYSVFTVGDRRVYVTHGHKFNMSNLPNLMTGDILLHGHTHIPAWQQFDSDNWYLNPGSVSIPKQGSEHSYMTLEDGLFIWKNLQGEEYNRLELK